MPHFPKPFFKQGRGLWYVEIDRRQHNLGPDREQAFARYHELMRRRPKEADTSLDGPANKVASDHHQTFLTRGG